jgi:hypothetical protein
MAVQIQGSSGTVAEVSGTGFRSLKVQQMPLDAGALGIYRKSLISGTMAAGLAAGSEIFQFRWTDATRLCAIRRVSLDGLAGSATAFTAGFGKVDMVPARAFTVDGTGGTSGTLTGNNAKLRTSMGTSLAAAIRIASTAALTAGTKTLDTDPIAQYTFTVGVVVSAQYATQTVLLGEDVGPEHPLILATNEGFVLRATLPATGTWQFGVTVSWAELTAY